MNFKFGEDGEDHIQDAVLFLRIVSPEAIEREGDSVVPKTSRPESSEQERVFDEAAAWLLRVRAAPDDPGVNAELEDWISRDPGHAAAWEAARRVWSVAGAVGPAGSQPEHSRALRRRGGHSVELAPRRSIATPARTWTAGLAVAAGICLAMILSPSLWLHLAADHATAVGETRTVDLADGSQVQLDSASAIEVKLTDTGRFVRLLDGQAYFSVKRDRRRPFTVTADEVEVVVTGTEFDVRIDDDEILVAVAEGEVRVEYPRGARSDGQTATEALLPGKGLTLRRRDRSAVRVDVPPRSIAAWRRGRLLVESATVGELVEELGRYRSGTILIVDGDLADRRVTGVFDLSDPVRALRTIVEPHAGVVREITPWLVIVATR